MSNAIDTRPAPMLGRRPALDGIRGAAILFVMVRHAVPHQLGGAGFSGVDLFFVLSGFLISTLLTEELDSRGRVALVRFYLRRALRLLPALYVLLAVAALFVAFAPYGQQHFLLWFAFAATYTTPFYEWFIGSDPPGIGVVWSLATEEYFYLLWPLILIAIWRFTRRRTTVRIFLIGVLLIVSIVVRWATWIQHGVLVYSMPWTWTDALLLGCLASALWKAGLVRHVPTWLQWLGVSAMVAFALFPEAKMSTVTYSLGLTGLAAACMVVVLSSVDRRPRVLNKLFEGRWLRWLGTRSYSLYLWNGVFLETTKPYPVPRAVDIVVGIALSLAVAELSYRFVERPALRLKRRLEPTIVQPTPVQGPVGAEKPLPPQRSLLLNAE